MTWWHQYIVTCGKNQLADNRLYVVTHSACVIRTSAISREEAIDGSYAIYWLHVYQPNCGLSIENMRRIPMRIHWNYIALHSDEALLHQWAQWATLRMVQMGGW